MARFKILQIGKHYWPSPGGMERVLRELSEGLVKKNYEVQCWVAHDKAQYQTEDINGVKVVRFPSLGSIASTPLTFWSRRYLEEYRPDLIHIHLPNPLPMWRYWGAAKLTVVSYHADVVANPWMTSLYNRMQKKYLWSADAIIVSSQRTFDSSPLHQWSLQSKVHVIPFGIDEERFKDPGSSSSGGVSRSVPGPVDLLFVGRLRAYKGLDNLIYAMEGTDAKLCIIGQGEEERRLKALVRHLQLDRQVQFLGYLSDADVARYMKATKILVLPSLNRTETLGLSLIEAMACGKPVISTRLPTGVLDVNLHGQTGVVVPPGNVPRLREAILRLLADGPQRLRLGQQGRQHYLKRFTSDKMVDAHDKVFQKLLQAQVQAAPASPLSPSAFPLLPEVNV